jgi:four helix bundle protein
VVSINGLSEGWMKRRDLSERSFRFAVDVVVLCRELRRGDRGVSGLLVSQLLRSATSVGANLEEARGAQSRADLIAKCSIACKEAREALYWLRLIQETATRLPASTAALRDEAGELVAILTRCIVRLKQGDH